MVAYPDSMLRNTESNTQPGCPAGAEISALSCFPCCKELFRQVAAQLFRPWIHNSMHCQHFPSALGPFLGMVQKQVITLAPKKLIRTRRASEGSASEPSLRVGLVCAKDAKLSCRGNTPRDGWGRRPQGDAPRSEASALGARWLLPARPQPPRGVTCEHTEVEPCPFLAA